MRGGLCRTAAGHEGAGPVSAPSGAALRGSAGAPSSRGGSGAGSGSWRLQRAHSLVVQRPVLNPTAPAAGGSWGRAVTAGSPDGSSAALKRFPWPSGGRSPALSLPRVSRPEGAFKATRGAAAARPGPAPPGLASPLPLVSGAAVVGGGGVSGAAGAAACGGVRVLVCAGSGFGRWECDPVIRGSA